MKIYRMVRDEDVSGVSGTGVVGEVAEFSDGTTTVRWLTECRSTAVYASLDDARFIHGHDGRTRFVQVYELVSDAAPPKNWCSLRIHNEACGVAFRHEGSTADTRNSPHE